MLKPIIIIDGFDPLDGRQILDEDPHPETTDLEHTSINEMMQYVINNDYENPIYIKDKLNQLGYDVIIVNHPTYVRNDHTIDGGADYIERNAMNHVSLYKTINNVLAANGSNEELVIVGPSMGGQISRFALAYMEKKYEETGLEEWSHNCRLWISSDSPHLGANIPMGLQTFLNLAAPDNSDAEDFVEDWLQSAAARQQLIEQYNGYSGSQLNQTYLDGRTILQGFSENRGHPYFVQYYNNLYSNGLSGSRGYPQNTRKVAFINGSLSGGRQYEDVLNGETGIFANHGEKTLDIVAYQYISNMPIPVGIVRAYNMPAYNNNTEITNYWRKFYADRHIYATNINSRGNMDVVPGGFFPGYDRMVGELGDPIPYPDPFNFGEWFSALFSDLLGGAFYVVYKNGHVSPFIPAVSSLGLNNPNTNWATPLGNRNLVCSGEIPFDNYFGPNVNEGHDQFTQTSVEWLLEELSDDGVFPEPPVKLSSNNMQGPNAICNGNVEEFFFDTCLSNNPTWEVSGNLQIVGSNDEESVFVESNTSSSTSGYVRAIFDEITIEKDVWLNEPAAPAYLYGPTTVTSGSIVNYNCSIAPGAEYYNWILPDPFDRVSYLDYSADNWQISINETDRFATVFTGVNGANGNVQVMGVNECNEVSEWGSAAILWVEHGSGGSGGIPIPLAYPNTSDEAFTLDFTDQSSDSQFYIYLYDQYTNIEYEGECNNVEKTIETLNLAEGIYYLHIYEYGEVVIQQIVIEH